MVELPVRVGVTVIAAHMGLGRLTHGWRLWRNFSTNPDMFGDDYHQLLEWLEIYPNLYADLSAILPPMRARALPHLARQTQIHHKLLFGTDYPVPFNIQFNRHDLRRRDCTEIAAIANPFDRYSTLLERYFPPSNPLWTNHRKVLDKT